MYISHFDTKTVHTLKFAAKSLCTSLTHNKKDRAPVSQCPGIYRVPKADDKL